MISAMFRSFRDAFGQYSGLFTFAGFALIIVFGAKYIQLRGTLDQASAETAITAVVLRVQESTCTRSMNTSIQAFNVQQRCLEVDAEMEGAQNRIVTQHIVVEQSNVGSLAAGDHVYVVPADTGIDRYFIVNAHDDFGFFVARYEPAGYALLGALLVLASYLIKRSRPNAGEGPSV